jgi:Mrp family chromosome partitioning ATPase
VDLGTEEGTTGDDTGPGTLDILVAGQTPPAPAEFLKSQKVSGIIDALDERSDLLLVDTPPLLHVSDAMNLVLARRIDCLLLAARLGVVRRQELAEVKRLIENAPIIKLGFFATGAKVGDAYGYGYYSYGQKPYKGGDESREVPTALS